MRRGTTRSAESFYASFALVYAHGNKSDDSDGDIDLLGKESK